MENIKFSIIPILTKNNINNFWNKVAITANDGICWNWNGTKRSSIKPYGRFLIQKKLYSAHRVSYLINNGVDPKEMHVLHKCDNHKCVNPKHLFLGTNADNVADKVSKNRQARGNNRKKSYKGEGVFWRNNCCKATESDFKEMLSLYKQGGTVKDLVKKFKVAKKTVSDWLKVNGITIRKIRALNDKQVFEIKRDYIKNDYINKTESNIRELIKKYNIGRKTIYDIVNGVTWKNI